MSKNPYHKSTNKKDPMTIAVMEKIKEGKKSRKEIANELGITLSFVQSVAKINNAGQISINEQSNEKVNNANESFKERTYECMEKEEFVKLWNEYDCIHKHTPKEFCEEYHIDEETYDDLTKKYLYKRDLSDDTILEILDLIEQKTITQKEIAKIYHLHYVKVCKIKKEFFNNKDGNVLIEEKKKTDDTSATPKNTESVEEKIEIPNMEKIIASKINKSEESISENKNIPFYEGTLTKICPSSNILSFGLIKNRHEMPVDEYIYPFITEKYMFNFLQQEIDCTKFIKDHVEFDESGIPLQRLEIYVSGLQTPLGSLCKVCYKLKINLTLKHYNRDNNGAWRSQIIYDDFDISKGKCKNIFQDLLDKYNSVFIYNSTVDNITKSDELYAIIDSTFTGAGTKSENVIIFNNYNDIWKIYGNIVKENGQIKNKRKGVFINNCKIFKDGLIRLDGPSITKSFNFEK